MDTQNKERVVIASACSKVLVTGAYLILDPKYSGAVLATDAKFYCSVKKVTAKGSEGIIKVISK